MSHLEVNGAELWVEVAGEGLPVVFVHGGLGDARLWEPQAQRLAGSFRCVRYDRRFFGRSTGPAEPWRETDDLVGVLDALKIEQAALVGLSGGGGLVLDAAAAHPDRVWAIAHVSGSVSGLGISPYTEEQAAESAAALRRRDLDAVMAIDFAVWAPLGETENLRELWLATARAQGVPKGAEYLSSEPASEQLTEFRVPALVVIAAGDPPNFREGGRTVAERVPGARLVDFDSDHYLTLREPEQLSELLLEFLRSVIAP
jgi:3-oxoadipate enol-lactonase